MPAFNGNFVAFGGLSDVLQFLHHYKFTADDIVYIRSVLPSEAEDAFFSEYLPSVDCSDISVYARREGSLCFPNIPLLSVEGPLAVVQLLETTLLNLVGYSSLVATNAARCRLAAGPDAKLVEFGLRRAQGPDGGMHASKYSYLGGFDGTSNMLAGSLYGIPVYGTHAHAFVQSFGSLSDISLSESDKVFGSVFRERVCEIRRGLLSDEELCKANDGELAAFISYAVAYPSGFLALADTYDTLASGVPNFIAVGLALMEQGRVPVGIRLDSGDLAELSWRSRCRFGELVEKYSAELVGDRVLQVGFGLEQLAARMQIMASSDLNESKLLAFRSTRHSLNAFGIGTELVTCRSDPALGCVFKLVEVGGEPRIKLSEDAAKSSIPRAKCCYRVFETGSESGRDRFVADILTCKVGDAPPITGEEYRYVEETLLRNSVSNQDLDIDRLLSVVKPSRVEVLLEKVWGGADGAAKTGGEYWGPNYLGRARDNLREEVRTLVDDFDGYQVGSCLSGKVGLSMPLAALLTKMNQTS